MLVDTQKLENARVRFKSAWERLKEARIEREVAARHADLAEREFEAALTTFLKITPAP